MTDNKEYRLTPIICLTCGYDGEKSVPVKLGLPEVDTCKCPKCSQTAYVHYPLRQLLVINALVKAVIKLRLDVMDLQDDGEDR